MRPNNSKKRVDEKLEDWIGNYGATAIRQAKNRWSGDIEGEMTVAQKMGKDRFINNFVSRVYSTLSSEIQSGRVDPNPSQAKPDPQTAAKLKARLKTGQGIGKKTGAGFSNYVKGSGTIQRESRYAKLNELFESMLTEAETISQFLNRWLPTYMRGTDMSDSNTQALVKKVQDTYSQDKGKAALTQLANAAYAASYAPGYGTQSNTSQGQRSTSQLVKAVNSSTNAKELVSTIRAGLLKLNKLDATAYKTLVQDLAKAASTPAPAMPTGVTPK